jgi:adenine-specific DNA-methyltransferase
LIVFLTKKKLLKFFFFKNKKKMSFELHCSKFEDFVKNEQIQADLIVSSPPYGIGKSYEEFKTVEDYEKWAEDVIIHMKQCLNKEHGAVCFQVGTHVNPQTNEYLPLDILFTPLFLKHGFFLKNRIIWTFGSGLHSTKRLSGRYEVLLWFVLNPNNFRFHLDDIRVMSKEPGKRSYKGPRKGELSGNPLGKNPSDVWEIMQEEWEKSMWEFPNVKSNHVEKVASHPCQFPVELAERCILAFSNQGDVVLDMFCGTGSTGCAAAFHQRRFIGVEMDPAFIEISRERIKSAIDGTLKSRKIGTKIQEASVEAKTKIYPKEWDDLLSQQKKKPRIYPQYS